MKPSLRCLVWLLLIVTMGPIVHAQSQSYYVVIGAFAKESNAKKFSGFSKSRFFQSTYELNVNRNLFYVYVIKTNSKTEAFDQVRILQQEDAFKDSWVFKGTLGNASPPPPVVTSPDPEPVEPTPPPVDVTTVSQPAEEIKAVDTTTVQATPTETEKPKRVVKGKLFRFDIQSSTGEAIAGKIHHVDLLKGRDIASYAGNDYSDVPKPADEPMTLVCAIFGYKENTLLIDYQTPSSNEGATQDAEGAWVIPFKLERLKKGDVSVMYDVSFYKDAVIMLPRSKEELDELVSMMTANPAYKIKVHGHTNGNNKRKIIGLGKNRNYFEMAGSDQHNGSAKELSKERAEAVQDYLAEHGIEKSRIEIMAWGGTNMLASETGSSAKLNDRIEIEIMED